MEENKERRFVIPIKTRAVPGRYRRDEVLAGTPLQPSTPIFGPASPNGRPVRDRIPTPFCFGSQPEQPGGHAPHSFNVRNPGPSYPQPHPNPLRSHPVSPEDYKMVNPRPSCPPCNPLGSHPVSAEDCLPNPRPAGPPVNTLQAHPVPAREYLMQVGGFQTGVQPQLAEDHPMPDAHPMQGAHPMEGAHDMREMYRQVAKIRGLPQSRPLYGHILINEFGQGKFNPTQRFNDWLGDACLCTEQDDFFHQWLRDGGHKQYAKPEEEDRQLKRKRGEAKEYPTPLESLHTLEKAWMDYMSKKQARVDELTSRMERLLQPPLSAQEVNNKKRPAVSGITPCHPSNIGERH